MKRIGRDKRAQMMVFLILFSLIMGIGLISAFYKILAFEQRAENMVDGTIDAQYFKKDYMLALTMPVQNVTICHNSILKKNCAIYIKVPKEPEMIAFKYPEVSVEIDDPKANISIALGMETMNETRVLLHDPVSPMIIPHAKQTMILPEIRSLGGCTEDDEFRYCKYLCTSPIQITKYREYESSYDITVDRINVSQFMGDKCLS